MRAYAGLAMLLLAFEAIASAPPANDEDTRAWWNLTARLSDDAMQGRDTGSAGYLKAAQLVAAQFKAAGLEPLGVQGGWFQPVAMNEIDVERAELRVGSQSLTFLYDLFIEPTAGTPVALDVPLAYRGYCAASGLGEVRGKLVICHGTHRAGLPSAAERETAVRAAGGAGMLTIADPGFAVEPPRWPFAYAHGVTLATAPSNDDAFLQFRLNADALGKVLGTQAGRAAGLIADGSRGGELPSFDLKEPLHARFVLHHRRISSPNVIGRLPGSDPGKADQAIVVSAHLDGYGHGTPIAGDSLYNGTLDDAAYVALIIRLAQRQHSHPFRRPVVFAAFTGEEKGLLGAEWFVAHPTLLSTRIAADINLDQLRPIFPLELLTVHALDDSTLGDDVKAVAADLKILVQHDPEPERNLLRRADQWPFLKAGIPATAFVFGYRPGSDSERIYREWYRSGYHKPQDDLRQRMDWQAAADFNRFFYALVARIADKDQAPAWKAGSVLNGSSATH
jgi:hypothetical protein